MKHLSTYREKESHNYMKNNQLKGVQKLDLEMANVQWNVNKWQLWTIRNNVGLILEDGKVVGWEVKPERFHK